MSDPPDTDPADVSPERIADLERRIEELSRELRTPPRGPLGLPRPPTPGELLRVADDHAIPTAIAVLEANVRVLKLLRETVRLLRRTEEHDVGGRGDEIAREAVSELDRAVTDLREAVEGGGLPDDREARSLLRDVRDVRDEVAGALETGASGERASGGDSDDAGSSGGTGSGTTVDVESELDSIREEVRGEGSGNGGAAPDEAHPSDDPGDAS